MKVGKTIADATKKAISTVSGTLSKNSPTILIVAGTVGVIAGAVLAVRAGKISDEKTQPAKDGLDIIRAKKAEITEETEGEQAYTKLDYSKDLITGYRKLIFAYAKVYGPAALTTLFSLYLILTSHRILTDRYDTACIGFAVMSKAYDAYRQNVIDAEGFEADQRYRFGIKTVEEEKPLLDKDGNPKLDKNGEPKKTKVTYDILSEELLDPRSVLWDEITASGTYDNTSSDDYVRWLNNVNTVRLAQAASNNIMQARAKDPRNNGIGYIYLNEVLNKLGMKPVDIGQTVGWRYDPRIDIESDKYDPYYTPPADWGDNRVDFAIDNPDVPGYERRQMFIHGHEDAILLYMNYDGIINDKVCLKTIYHK